jgi:hypothetical protein
MNSGNFCLGHVKLYSINAHTEGNLQACIQDTAFLISPAKFQCAVTNMFVTSDTYLQAKRPSPASSLYMGSKNLLLIAAH